MFRQLASKSILPSLLAVSALLAAVPTAEAVSVRVRFTPPYGTPFTNLEYGGEAIVDDGGCTLTGVIDNSATSCNGSLNFTQASVFLSNTGAPNNHLQTIDFLAAGGGAVAFIERTNTTTFDTLYSAPFKAVQGTIAESKYNGTDQAYFSLIFQGKFAQLYWFDHDPGTLTGAAQNVLYTQCNLPGSNSVLGFTCGVSSWQNGKGAALEITPVPEPSTYALMLGGLAAVGFIARRRSRRA